MRARCLYPSQPHFIHYGGRGIKVCDRWQIFENFLEDMGPRPSSQHSLEREDNDGNYEPGNVKWATRDEQHRNTRRNVTVEIAGKKMILKDAALQCGIAYQSVRYRIGIGWPVLDALHTPPGSPRP